MLEQYRMDDMTRLAMECISLGGRPRPELRWLNCRYDRVKKRCGLRSKTETDKLLYERMYGRAPKKDSEVLKLRYWRTGKCMPGNREHCLLFGKALELSETEMEFFVQQYYDRGMELYDAVSDAADPAYRERRAYLKQIVEAYLRNVPENKLESLHIPRKKAGVFLRHIYFTDALRYIKVSGELKPEIINKHITSLRYESEFARQMRLSGEIPRKALIRHLLILGMPDVTLKKMNRQLRFFGYLPLEEEHTMARGERLDWLLIRLFQMYEEKRRETDDVRAGIWFREACRTLDEVFKKEGCSRLRFMHFKALDL